MTSNPKRILLLCEGDPETHDSWSGTSQSVVRSLREVGHTVIHGDVDLYGAHKALAAGLTFSPNRRRWWTKYHLNGVPFALRSKRAAQYLAKMQKDADLVLQFGATFFPDGCRLPLVLYCDATMVLARNGASQGVTDATFLTSSELRRIERREARVYAEASRVLTISERVRRSFVEDLDLAPESVKTVYAAPNLLPDSPPQPRPKSGPANILFIGRQFDRKGGEILLQAFRRLREDGLDVRLSIIGPRDLKLSEDGVTMRGLIDKDTTVGRQELIAAYQGATVFCVPSRFEGLSISFLEAMHFGVPCIGAKSPWVEPEMIDDGETGFVVPVDDVDALASRLRELVLDRELVRRMGARGRERALERFTWPQVARAMSEAFDEAVLSS